MARLLLARRISIFAALAVLQLWLVPILVHQGASAQTAPFSARINFQPATSSVPGGYIADTGQAFNTTRGFGWVREDSLPGATHVPLDVSPNARDRQVAGVDPRQNTFIHLQYPDSLVMPTAVRIPSAWEYALRNGSYTVALSVGDACCIDSIHRINVEGINVVNNFVPTPTNRFLTITRTITVSDGLLTVDAIGGFNSKIDYIHIASTGSPTATPTQLPTPSATPTRSPLTPTNTPATPTIVLPPPTVAAAPSATPSSSSPAGALRANFQSQTAPVPPGYIRDFGESFGLRTGVDQGSNLSYGWVDPTTGVPVSLVGVGRDRDRPGIDQRLDTVMQFQLADVPYYVGTPRGTWEIALPNGTYSVTLSTGDQPPYDSNHVLNIEGSTVINYFQSTATLEYRQVTALTRVLDGRLTVDAARGRNTKINYIEILPDPASSSRPSVTSVTPANGALNVLRDSPLVANVFLPNVGRGVDAASLSPQTVRLVQVATNGDVLANRNTSGGGDVIVLQPSSRLEANTEYRFEISGVKDLSGATFLPYSVSFTTGANPTGSPATGISFQRVDLPSTAGRAYTSLVFGPDGKLYATVNNGEIVRFSLGPDGTPTGNVESITSLQAANGGSRLLVGLAFDPASTADDLIAWVTHTTYGFNDMPNWGGKVTRLSGPALQNVTDYVTGLPRSIRDHVTNGLAFGPDGALYVLQGSTSAMGEADNTWGLRPETPLSAAVLRVDLPALVTPPLNVQTAEGGTYDPFAPGAPVKVYASGVRNAYDLVFHSNGQLYVPTNGSAGGGNIPSTSPVLPRSCERRIDDAGFGDYLGPAVVGVTNVLAAQPDFLNRITAGGYYGHPNPSRCEWVLNGGNPTDSIDQNEVSTYAVGTMPDRNYRGAAFNFGISYSPNGVIEYQSNTFSGQLRGRLLVTRYSAGDDVIVLTPGGPNLDIVASQTGIPGLTGLVDPLDLVEDRSNGNLYVSEYSASRIVLFRPG